MICEKESRQATHITNYTANAQREPERTPERARDVQREPESEGAPERARERQRALRPYSGGAPPWTSEQMWRKGGKVLKVQKPQDIVVVKFYKTSL